MGSPKEFALGCAVVCACCFMSEVGQAQAKPSAALAPMLEHCGLEPQGQFLAPVAAKTSEVPGLGASGLPPVRRQLAHAAGVSEGILSGKSVYVSPGHGWLRGNGVWQTQRGNTNGIVEDLVSTEAATQYLVKYLRNMGAYVVTLRENDMNPNRAYGDDSLAGFSAEGEVVLREGPAGFAVAETYESTSSPFSLGTSKVFDTNSNSTGHVRWSLEVPADGEYNVYVGYSQAADRASDARYTVQHAGGETSFLVDQRRHGGTWVFLGNFYFRQDGAAALLLDNHSEQPGATLSADVVRMGGGASAIAFDGVVSGRPMFEDSARHYTQYAGAPESVWVNGDVSARSRFAAWDHEAGEDAVYLAWHSNATGGAATARGTSSFAYGPTSFGPISGFSGTDGSVELLTAVHNELMTDLQLGWDSEWQEFGNGLYAAFFGEVNPQHNPEMPAGLFEVAFHDNPADAQALSDPGYRRIAARAMAQGVAKFFADKDGRTLVLPPDEPTSVAAEQEGESIFIHWQAPTLEAGGGDAAERYMVYLSSDGLAFDSGTQVDGNSYLSTETSARYARITAINAGGESLPSAIVGARASGLGRPQVLIVNDYSRLDHEQLLRQDLSAFALGTVKRMDLSRMNDRSYIARYGAAVDAAGVSFASSTSEAVRDGLVDLQAYTAVIWFSGENRISVLDADELALLEAYLSGGGALMVAGSDVASSLDASGNSFLADSLGARFVADAADGNDVDSANGAWAAVGALRFGEQGAHSFRTDSADVMEATASAELALRYGDSRGAAVLHLAGDAKSIVMGFPFETIESASSRAALMAAMLTSFALQPDAPPEVQVGEEPDAGVDPPGVEAGCGCRASSTRGESALGLLLLVLALAALRRTKSS